MERKTSQISGNPVTIWIERCLLAVLSAIPIPQFKIWTKALFHPTETFDAQKSSISFRRLAIELGLVLLICTIYTYVYIRISNGMRVLDIISIDLSSILGIVGSFIELFVVFVIFTGVLYVLVKILGGKGKFSEHAYAIAMLAGALVVLLSLTVLPLYVLNAIMRDAGITIPGIALSAGMCSIALVYLFAGIYGTYKYLVMMRHVHQLSNIRTALLVVLSILVFVPMIIVVGFAFMLSGMIGGMR